MPGPWNAMSKGVALSQYRNVAGKHCSGGWLSISFDEDFADVAECVAGAVEECDHFDAFDVVVIEESLAAC